jgi:TBC1 domain family member 15
VHRTDRTISPFMEEDLPHPDPESQYSGTNAHLEMLKDTLMTYNMYDNKQLGIVPKTAVFGGADLGQDTCRA